MLAQRLFSLLLHASASRPSIMSGAEIFGIVAGAFGLIDIIKRFVDAVRDVSSKLYGVLSLLIDHITGQRSPEGIFSRTRLC